MKSQRRSSHVRPASDAAEDLDPRVQRFLRFLVEESLKSLMEEKNAECADAHETSKPLAPPVVDSEPEEP